MSKTEALALIDKARDNLAMNPMEMLNWVWLRLFIVAHTDEEFEAFMQRVADIQ